MVTAIDDTVLDPAQRIVLRVDTAKAAITNLMLDGGVYLAPSAFEAGFTSIAHGDAELARHGQDWFLGADYSALDAYVFTLCRWTRHFASAPARERPHLRPYLRRMLDRPAVGRVLAAEQLQPPYV